MASQGLNINPATDWRLTQDTRSRVTRLYENKWSGNMKGMAYDLQVKIEHLRVYLSSKAPRQIQLNVVDSLLTLTDIDQQWLRTGEGSWRKRKVSIPPPPAVPTIPEKPICGRIKQLATQIWHDDLAAMSNSLAITVEAITNIIEKQIEPSDNIIRTLEFQMLVNRDWLLTGNGDTYRKAEQQSTVLAPLVQPITTPLVETPHLTALKVVGKQIDTFTERLDALERLTAVSQSGTLLERLDSIEKQLTSLSQLTTGLSTGTAYKEMRDHIASMETEVSNFKQGLQNARKADNDSWTTEFQRHENLLTQAREGIVTMSSNYDLQATSTQLSFKGFLDQLTEFEGLLQETQAGIQRVEAKLENCGLVSFEELSTRLAALEEQITEPAEINVDDVINPLVARITALEKRPTVAGTPEVEQEAELEELQLITVNEWLSYAGPYQMRLYHREVRRIASRNIGEAYKRFNIQRPAPGLGGSKRFWVRDLREYGKWHALAGLEPDINHWYSHFKTNCLSFHKRANHTI